MTQNNEREAVVRWLRAMKPASRWNVAEVTVAESAKAFADRIERGDHLENTNDTN